MEAPSVCLVPEILEYLATAADRDVLATLPCCPGRTCFQWIRRTDLAERVLNWRKYGLIDSAVAVAKWEAGLNGCPRKSRISELCL